MVVVCLKPESIACEVPAVGLVTFVSGSLIVADVVSSFGSLVFVPNTYQLRQKEQENK